MSKYAGINNRVHPTPIHTNIREKLKSKQAIMAEAKYGREAIIHIMPLARLYFFTLEIFSAGIVSPAQKCIGVFRHKAQIPIAAKTNPHTPKHPMKVTNSLQLILSIKLLPRQNFPS